MLSAADAACYVAKEAGRNRIHVYQPDDSAVAERYGEMQWIHRIRKAFDDDRFCSTSRRSGRSARARQLREIFIRMVDEDGTLVPPVAFIPAAERYHLIVPIDRWVVAHGLEALARDPSGQTFTINLSGQSITQESFLDFVQRASSAAPASTRGGSASRSPRPRRSPT